MNIEQLEFDFDFESGEHTAPVSDMFKVMINEMLNDAVLFEDKQIYEYYIINLKSTLKKSKLLKKCSKHFQQEAMNVLDTSFETMYEHLKGRPFNINADKSNKPELKLVK